MNPGLPAIAKQSARVAAAIEEAVTRFPRRHKYGLGADLRGNAVQVMRAVRKAWRERSRQLQRVHELSAAIDNLKDSMMLADAVKAFGSFAEFEAVARLVNDLGRQCGGWLKALHSTGQNEQGQSLAQRAPTLSSRAAPQGATP